MQKSSGDRHGGRRPVVEEGNVDRRPGENAQFSPTLNTRPVNCDTDIDQFSRETAPGAACSPL
jgi:hypothetical protein